MIYLDSAATSLQKPAQVTSAMVEAVKSLGNPGRGAHSHSLDASKCVYQGRKTIASFFGAAPQQVVFTAGATESLNIAISGLLKPADHVITTVYEHNSVLRPLYSLGAALSIVKEISCCHLKPNTKAVVITHASNLTGQILDLQAASKFCKKHGLLLIVDAAQTAGLIPLNIKDMDVLCFTGHKSLLGPQGIGGLVVGRDINITPTKFGGSGTDSFSKTQPGKLPESLEAGTLNTPGIAGLTAGIEYICRTGMENMYESALKLAKLFHEGVAATRGVKIYSGLDAANMPIVALNIGNMDSAMVEFNLSNKYGISTRGGAHCAPLLHKLLGTEEQGAVRFSFSSFNTEAEVQAAIKAVDEIARGDHI